MLGVLVFGRSHRLMQRLLFPTFCIVGALREYSRAPCGSTPAHPAGVLPRTLREYSRAMPRTLRCETNEQPG